MAIVQTALYRVRQGKNQQFLLDVTVARKILERLGARVRVLNQIIGTNAPCTIVIIESEDWQAYADLQTKMETDFEWQKVVAKAVLDNRDPVADPIGTGLSTDILLG
jgi:hypothetical protein